MAQILGTDTATLEAAYTDTVFADMLDGAEIPPTAFKDQILFIGRELATWVGNNATHPARSNLYGRTVNLSDLDEIPTISNTGAQFVGVWDSCCDASDNTPCTWQPVQTIADLNQSFFSDVDFYHYNTQTGGNFIRTTRPSVFLQGVVWDVTAESDAYDNDDDSNMPDGLAPVWLDGIAARAAQVGWVDGGVFGYYNNLYQQGKADFNRIGGAPNIPLTAMANQATG